MKLHHIGIAVDNIEKYYNSVLKPLGYDKLSEIFYVESQNSKMAFASNGQSAKIELVMGEDENSPTKGILQRKMGGLYHLGFITSNFEEDVENLKKSGFRRLSNKDGIAYFISPKLEFYELIDSEKGWD